MGWFEKKFDTSNPDNLAELINSSYNIIQNGSSFAQLDFELQQQRTAEVQGLIYILAANVATSGGGSNSNVPEPKFKGFNFKGGGKITGKDIQFSDKLSNSQWQKQLNSRGWSNNSIANTINEPYTTRAATNRSTGNPATAYYNKNGSYVIRDNGTGKVVQVSDVTNSNWAPDPSIVDPYLP